MRIVPMMTEWLGKVFWLMFIALILFSPAGAASQEGPKGSPAEDAALVNFLRDYAKDDASTRYASAFVDLNGDGKAEAIVYLTGQFWCGSGGCTMLVLTPKRSSYTVVTATSVTRLPIRVLNTKSKGWRDLGVGVGGGGLGSYEARLSFNGKKYPGNPTVAPAKKKTNKAPGRIVVPANVEGVPLFSDGTPKGKGL